MTLSPRAAPVLAGCDQSAPDAAPAQGLLDEQLGNIGVAPFLGDDVDVVFLLDDDTPADCLVRIVCGDEDLAGAFAQQRKHLPKMVFRHPRIEAAVGLDGMLEVLRSHDEGEERRPIAGKIGLADAHVSPAT